MPSWMDITQVSDFLMNSVPSHSIHTTRSINWTSRTFLSDIKGSPNRFLHSCKSAYDNHIKSEYKWAARKTAIKFQMSAAPPICPLWMRKQGETFSPEKKNVHSISYWKLFIMLPIPVVSLLKYHLKYERQVGTLGARITFKLLDIHRPFRA